MVDECTWKEGIITLKWKLVGGATKYRLIIKDELQKENLVPDRIIYVKEEGRDCEANFQMSDQLGIGRTCVTKVMAYIGETVNSVSDWKIHLIGGVKVARNVQALRNIENPFRAMNISFDFPKHGNTSLYKVVAIPSSGRKKTILTKSNPTLFEYLRKGVEYKFEVWAKWDDKWFGPSLSNSVFTEGAKPRAMVKVGGMTNSSVDLRGAHLSSESTDIAILQGNDFGCIRDLSYTYKQDPDADLVTMNWTEPTFGNKRSDYKIEKFKTEIRKSNASDGEDCYIEYGEGKQQYSNTEYKLALGELHNVYVYTIYEDIDQDVLYVSSAVKLSIHTRPNQPRIYRNHAMDSSLKIEWSKAKGATSYEVDLITESSAHPFTTEVNGTSYTKTFDEMFGYGTSYYAVVRAYGQDGKCNESKTERKVIGGDRVPTNVAATTQHERVKDPNFQVFLTWTAPQRSPKEYQIEVISEKCCKKICGIVGETYLAEDLRAGTEYFFKVKAKHHDENISGGCCSNKIQTNPTPTQVKRVWFQPGDNPSTSQIVFWEKVEAERENENTEYRIHLKRYDEKKKGKSEQKAMVDGDHIMFKNLHPGASYSVTVAGGNSVGFGRESEEVSFTTEWGTPKNIILSNNKTSPSSSMIMTFDEAEGDVLHYIGTLYKYQNKTEQFVMRRKVMSPHIFEDLDSNSDYIVRVHTVMEEGIGKEVASNKAITAPSNSIITHYNCCKLGEEFSSKEIYAKWRSDPGCDEHEVIIRCGYMEKPECRLIVANESEIKYVCRNEATEYSIQVRSRNSSGLFGHVSDRVIIQLAPTKLEHAMAVLSEESYNIKISCSKPAYQSPFFLMNAYCDGNIVQIHPDEGKFQDTEDTIEWIFTPAEFAAEYTFELWAEESTKLRGKKVRTSTITSRPSKVEMISIQLLETFPSADIRISWKEQPRCNMYEVEIKIQGKDNCEALVSCRGNSFVHRCLSTGDKYFIRVRAICGSAQGFWSNEHPVTLAPSEINFIEDDTIHFPTVSFLHVAWSSPYVKPDGYLLFLFCDNGENDQIYMNQTEHSFEKSLMAGSICRCTVAAYNENESNSKIYSKVAKSKFYKIKWNKPNDFSIELDRDDPTRQAHIKWEWPHGVTQFKIEIKNHQTGSLIISEQVTASEYIYKGGVAGNTYSVKLYCGSDSQNDNTDYLQKVFTLMPNPPSNVHVLANKEANGLDITIEDSFFVGRKYKVSLEPSHSHTESIRPIETCETHLTVKNLVPGEAYKVSVRTLFDGVLGSAVLSKGYIYTFPDRVQNLDYRFNDGILKFEWDPLKIDPDEYTIQYQEDRNEIMKVDTKSTNFEFNLVEPNKCYRVRVMAVTKSGGGLPTDWITYRSGSTHVDLSVSTSTSDTTQEVQSEPQRSLGHEQQVVDSKSGRKINFFTDQRIRDKCNVFFTKINAAGTSVDGVLKFVVDVTEDTNTEKLREVINLTEVMRHENIVKVFSSGFCKYEGKDSIYIEMERCEEESLWDRLWETPFVYSEQKKTEIIGIAKGLWYIHQNHILHRDLKPQNILFVCGRPVICDFGWSKKLGPSKSCAQQSKHHVGTDGWMAPETCQKFPKGGKSSDVFSAGLIFHFILSNGHPFGDDSKDWYSNIKRGWDFSLDLLYKVANGELAVDLVEQMLDREPKQRPSMEEVLMHPFLWEEKTRIHFLRDVIKAIELVKAKEERKIGVKIKLYECSAANSLDDISQCDITTKKYAEKINLKTWMEGLKLDDIELELLQRRIDLSNLDQSVTLKKDCIKDLARSYQIQSVTEIVRFIRNRYAHDHEDKGSLNIHMTVEELWRYFNKRNPYLFLYVYRKMKTEVFEKKKDADYSETDTLERYFYVHKSNTEIL